MRRVFFGIIMMAALAFSCNSKNGRQQDATTNLPSEEDVPYTIAQRYFVKNNFQKNQLTNPIIDSQLKFDEIFGMATVMGPDGKPTAINFDEQIAIAVILDETDNETAIQPEKLVAVNNKYLKLDYKVMKGPIMTMTIRPFLLLLIDKKYKDHSIEIVPHSTSK
jgi:hypothetical protein